MVAVALLLLMQQHMQQHGVLVYLRCWLLPAPAAAAAAACRM
jgi:hypothetical protein